MLDKYSLPKPFEDVRSNISFYFPKMDLPISSYLDPLVYMIELKSGSPQEILELNDVYVTNEAGMNCLYDSSGRRISQSCVRRGVAGNEYIESYVSEIQIPRNHERILEPVIYLSNFYRHWGHFLTETISRLWARYEHPELRELKGLYRGYFPSRLVDYRYVFDYFGNSSIAPLRLMSMGKDIKIDKCFVPAPSFSNRNEAYSSHLTSPHDVARSCLRDNRVEARSQPVYLSRSRLKNIDRVILNEDELVTSLSNHGVNISYPEELSLEEQILMFNSYNVFVGCIGSAFHSLIFSLQNNGIVTYVLCEEWINQNFIMFDAIVGNSSNYLCVLRHEGKEIQSSGVRKFKIDIEATIEHLKHDGVI